MHTFSMNEVSELVNGLNIITKINCVLYDKDFRILHNYSANMCPFCALVRTNGDCHNKCLASDLKGFSGALSTGQPYSYRCHMGLTETVAPIVCDDEIVGFMMMGQNLRGEDYETVKKRVKEFPDESKRDLMLKELDKMRFVSDEDINALIEIVGVCTEYLRMKKLIKYKEMPLGESLKNYILEHIRDEITVNTLCREFKMSKSSLYLLAKKTFGLGVTDYIRKVRMEQAAVLLRETDDAISVVAERVGYLDSNYFTKAFHKHYAASPKAWRQQKVNTDKK